MSTLERLQQRYNKSLLTKKETAQELNISTATLDRLRKSNAISSKKIGGKIFLTLKNVSDFIDA